jgi:hypothetical protein
MGWRIPSCESEHAFSQAGDQKEGSSGCDNAERFADSLVPCSYYSLYTLGSTTTTTAIPSRLSAPAPSRLSRWATEHYESYDLLDVLLTDAEKSLEAFYRACYDAGQTDCPLVRQEDHSWRDVETRVNAFLESVYHAPLAAWEARRPGLVTSGYIRRE